MTPLLSIIVPTLSVDLELRRCIDSVELTIPDFTLWELVLVLPKGTSGATAFSEATALYPRARIIVESRPSVYAAMNDGAAASTGRYLYFLGKDDILLPSMCEVLKLVASVSPSALFADVYWGTRGLRKGRTSRWQILFVNACHQGIIYSRESFAVHGPYIRRFRMHADQLLNIRLFWDEGIRQRMIYMPRPIALYSGTGISSRTFDANFVRVQPAIIQRFIGPVPACLWRVFKWFRLRWHRGN